MLVKTIPTLHRSLERLLAKILEPADVVLNGSRPFDIKITNPRALGRIISQGSLGLGESYMDGQWECERIDELIERLLRNKAHQRFAYIPANIWLGLLARTDNRCSCRNESVMFLPANFREEPCLLLSR